MVSKGVNAVRICISFSELSEKHCVMTSLVCSSIAAGLFVPPLGLHYEAV